MTTPKNRPANPHAIASGTRPSSRPRDSRASPAPNNPTLPQAAICHGVHGPWPKNRFDTSAASAPTANPGAPPRAKPENSTMSVVGLTLGTAANAIRPITASAASAPTSASTRALGCLRSYQANPAASATASTSSDAGTQLIEPPARGRSTEVPDP